MNELKYKITDKAKELFLKYGLRSITIDDICKELHISKKTFYTVIKGKEELIETVLEQMREKNDKADVECDDIVKVLADTLGSIKRNDVVEKHINLFFDLQKYYPDIMERHESLAKKADVRNTARKIQIGIEQGYFRENINVDAMAVIFNIINISKVYGILKKHLKMSTAQIVDIFMDMYIRILANENGIAHYQELKEQERQ